MSKDIRRPHNRSGDKSPQEPTHDEVQLVAAALGLKASAWAQAIIHLLPEPEGHLAQNGEEIEPPTEAQRRDGEVSHE